LGGTILLLICDIIVFPVCLLQLRCDDYRAIDLALVKWLIVSLTLRMMM